MLAVTIAIQDLRDRNQRSVLRAAINLMRKHSQFDVKWSAFVRSPSSQQSRIDAISGDAQKDEARYDEQLAMLASRWAVDSRADFADGDGVYLIGQYRDDTITLALQKLHPKRIPSYPDLIKILQSESASDEQKSAALCWFLHIIVELHQPLVRLSSGKTSEKTGRPKSVNKQPTIVLVSDGRQESNWSERFDTISQEATNLRRAFPREAILELQRTDLLDIRYLGSAIIEESLALGPKTTISPSPSSTSNSTGLLDESSADLLAKRRLLVAGYRLSDALVNLVASKSIPGSID